MPTHNMYVDLAAQMGLPALMLYLGILATIWLRLRGMERELHERGAGRSFAAIFNAAVQCFLVNLCVFGLSGDVEFEYSVFIMLGMGVLLVRMHSEGAFMPERAAGEAAGS
jgi:O-antigen ligase